MFNALKEIAKEFREVNFQEMSDSDMNSWLNLKAKEIEDIVEANKEESQ